ncbi:CYFA0S32e00936g1_1 [Cyberlindnera fabianii]|uniref:CYFA0S32e00936g1_1 n=1 Tax=Cyberlindnera fabianii TaxID=36022 RepID=A0A061BC20_CYBFA|nr:CYFA0S32e00936g1_1 [Cyberlindnera fabianii]
MRGYLTKIITAAALISVAAAAVHQRCVGFEEPVPGYNTFLAVLNKGGLDSSVLIYHIEDIDHTNIPLFVDETVIEQEPNGFAVCTQKRSSMELCNGKDVGQFIYTEDTDLSDHIVNTLVSPGQGEKYEVKQSGIYCAVVYQEGTPEVEKVEFVENHWYGNISLAQWESLKVMLLISLLIFISVMAINFMFRGAAKAYIGTLLDDIRVMFSLKSFVILWKSMIYTFVMTGPDHQFALIDPLVFADQMYSVLCFLLLYKLSIGVFGITKEKFTEMTIDKKFKIMIRLFAFASLIQSFYPIINTHLIIFAPILIAVALIILFIWIPMVYILWKNAKATEREMMDPVFARNYSLSRKVALWIPVTCGVISFFGMVTIQASSSANLIDTPTHASPYSSFAHALEASISQNFWFVTLKHLPDFSMLFLLWALIIIWKPVMLERTEDIHSNQLSDGSHAALKLDEQSERQGV